MMGKSIITMTASKDWWLKRVTAGGRNRYPDRIHVGDLKSPRLYVPERTCHMDLTETDTYELTYRTWECSECGQSCEEIYGAYEYCPHCGRKVVSDGD